MYTRRPMVRRAGGGGGGGGGGGYVARGHSIKRQGGGLAVWLSGVDTNAADHPQ